MKKATYIIGLAVAFAACNSVQKENSKLVEKFNMAENEMDSFVSTIQDTTLTVEGKRWAKENWEELNENFDAYSKKINSIELPEPDRLAYEERRVIRDSNWKILGERVTRTDRMEHIYQVFNSNPSVADLETVNNVNVVNKYQDFIEVVQLSKKEYTPDEWERIEVVWKALTSRSDQFDNLSNEQKIQIAKLKAKFAAMKAYRKTESKVEEAVEQNA